MALLTYEAFGFYDPCLKHAVKLGLLGLNLFHPYGQKRSGKLGNVSWNEFDHFVR